MPSDFDAAKPDVPLFRAPLYRATHCIDFGRVQDIFFEVANRDFSAFKLVFAL